MQVLSHKYILFSLLLVGAVTLKSRANTSETMIHQADSLFTIGKYSQASFLYKKIHESQKKVSPNLLLKLAFLAEKAQKPPESLYYLSVLATKNPSVELLKKMDQIATQQQLSGYEFNDLSYFKVYYHHYGGYLPMLMLTLGTYVVVVLFFKARNREPIQKRHKWAIMAYLLALLALFNVPDSYQSAVIRSEVTFVRDYPSAAAPVLLKLEKGHQLTVIGSRDVWSRVLWDRKILYILKSDLWMV